MPRVKRGLTHVKKRRKLKFATKGFGGKRKSHTRAMKEALLKAGAHAFRGRKGKKRTRRANWNVKINAAVRPHGLSYSKFIAALKKSEIGLDRKVLATLAEHHPKLFTEIINVVKK